ncbi:MAG: methyltransferase domain-containing protein [Sulfuricurvum sp.]
MTPFLLDFLCDPVSKLPLNLVNEQIDENGNIQSGELRTSEGKSYPIVNGIPRFTGFVPTQTVESFGDQWNHYNFTDFKLQWLTHTVTNTFGTPEAFRDKIIVDAGGGSGAQSKWFLEYGAKHVIVLELSHAVDGVIQHNLKDMPNVDIIQCSIDMPPLKENSIVGIVYCHNVIQHTPSVEKTAHALYSVVAPGGEFVFNCYPKNDLGLVRWLRFNFVYKPLRSILSRMPFGFIHLYSNIMAALRLLPGIGSVLEKGSFCVQGDVPKIEGESFIHRLKRRYKATSLNTFDCYGSHSFQHLKTDDEMRSLLSDLQPDKNKILNEDKYFLRPTPIGCALRVYK